jgi:hypothetical protein
MKVKMNYPVRTLSGRVDDTVFGSFNDGGYCQSRKYVVPSYTAQNQIIGTAGKNLKDLYKAANADYITDLKTYCQRNKKQNVPRTRKAPAPLAVFISMMYAWQKSDPLHVDLATVTIGDIITLDADVRTIARAVDGGFLKSLSLYSDLSADIQ